MAKKGLQRVAEDLEAIRKILTNGVWIAIVLVVLATLGWYLAQSRLVVGDRQDTEPTNKVVKPVRPPIPWAEVDQTLANALITSRQSARFYAEAELDLWIADLMDRVDNSFLDWYFDYWTQQSLGLIGLWQYGVHYVIEEQPTASEKLTEKVQEEFSQRVLRPQIAERVIERIVNETARRYVDTLQKEMADIPKTYSISRNEWHSHLENIAITTQNTEGNRQTPLTLKTLALSGAGGAVLLTAQIQTLIGKITGKVLAKSTGKAASTMATKTGGKVAAKVGGKFLGTIVGFGVLAWDIWDHKTTTKENRPILRQSVFDYFKELKLILLDDPEFGIMATFSEFEQDFVGKKKTSLPSSTGKQ